MLRIQSSNTVAIIVGVVVGIVVLCGIVVIGLLYIKRRRGGPANTNIELDEKIPEKPTASLNFTKIIPAEDIQVQSLLGSGNFGQVYKGTWHGTPVAMKKLKNADQMKEFTSEVEILG